MNPFWIKKNSEGKYQIVRGNEAIAESNKSSDKAIEILGKVFNIPSSALRGAYEEKDKTGIPVVGAIRGIGKGLKDPDYYVGADIENRLKNQGINPTLAYGVGLATEIALPGIGSGETKAIKNIGDIKAKNIKKVHRLVILPDYQGAGFGIRFLNEIGKIYKTQKQRYTIVTSAPSLINALKKSNEWICIRIGRAINKSKSSTITGFRKDGGYSSNRITASFELK